MSTPQPGILAPVPRCARLLELDLAHGADPRAVRDLLATWQVDGDLLVGIGQPLVRALGVDLPGLRLHPLHVGADGVEVPSTPTGLWLRVSGPDRGEVLHRARRLLHGLGPSVQVSRVIDCFVYREGDDLSGYEDGTENPVGDAAEAAALCMVPGLEGSSFLAVQQWVHDLDRLESFSQEQRDHTFGRRHEDNEELDDAPPSAHVKRAAQESFTPTALVLRRSMPWTDGHRDGLVFLAFGRSFDAYEAILHRMVGGEDGISDALFTFTRPRTGAFFWCPPLRDGRLDLSALAGRSQT